MKYTHVAATFALLLAVQRLALGGIGDVDASYGQNGRAQYPMLLLPDGRALYQGALGYGRLDVGGHPDESFWGGDALSWPMGFTPNWDARLRMADGSTLLGGSLQSAPAVVRLVASGEIDLLFAGNGVLTWPAKLSRSQVLGLALQNGRILVLTGEFYGAFYLDSPVEVLVRRLNTSLAIDTSFGNQGEALVEDYRMSAEDLPYVEAYGQKLTVLSDGRIKLTDQYPDVIAGGVAVRLNYLDANGLPAAQALPDPTLDTAVRDWRFAGGMPDGGALIDGYIATATGIRYRLFRLRADGKPDLAFGHAGSFTLDDVTGRPPKLSHISADGRYFYLAQEDDSGTSVTRIFLQGPMSGQADESFGQHGVVRIGAPLGLRAMQGVADGSLLLMDGGGTFRLLPSSTPSPGIISINTPVAYVDRAGQFTVHVTRSGGSDGVVSVNFATTTVVQNGVEAAVSGQDFQPVSGQLTWADGETDDKILSVTILPGYVGPSVEQYRPFAIQLDNMVGATWIEIPRITIYNTLSSSPPTDSSSASGNPAAATPAATTSGGGAFDLLSLLALCIAVTSCVTRRFRIVGAAIPKP